MIYALRKHVLTCCAIFLLLAIALIGCDSQQNQQPDRRLKSFHVL